MKPVNKAREKILLIKIQKYQDEASFSELYNHLVEPLYRFIYFKVSDKEIAQDLTAEVFLKSWRDLTKDDSTNVKHLKAYLYTVARNLVIDYYRSSHKQKEIYLGYKETQIPDEQQERLLEKVDVKIESERILAVIVTLKESYKEIIILRHIEELSIPEISGIINKSPVATRVLLHRANKALQREYEKSS